MDKISNLLQQVSIIQKKYDEIAKITGENFNVFSILKMDSKEVRMHSAFIGELLNSNGSHGLKEKPLEIFLELLKNKTLAKISGDNENKFILETKSSTTIIEKYIGYTNEDKTEGGRIDIIVEDKNKKAIIIENKIYAIEQTNQLIRYNNYSKKAPILYLTLYGDAPTSHGELKENIHYFNISYKEHIKEWLELCLKEAVEFPMLREVIKQYIYLIKRLTQQSINNNMSKDIVEIMQKEIEASFEISNNISELKNKIIEDLITKFQNSDVISVAEKMNDDPQYGGIWLKPKGIERTIGLFLWKGNKYFDTVFIGFRIDAEFQKSKTDKYQNAMTFTVEKDWIWKYTENYWGDNPETWGDLARPLFKTEKEVASIRGFEIITIIKEIIEIENS